MSVEQMNAGAGAAVGLAPALRRRLRSPSARSASFFPRCSASSQASRKA